MNTSELIAKLQKSLEQHGDLEVAIECQGWVVDLVHVESHDEAGWLYLTDKIKEDR